MKKGSAGWSQVLKGKTIMYNGWRNHLGQCHPVALEKSCKQCPKREEPYLKPWLWIAPSIGYRCVPFVKGKEMEEGKEKKGEGERVRRKEKGKKENKEEERERRKGKEEGKGTGEKERGKGKEKEKGKRKNRAQPTGWMLRRLGNFGLKNPCIDGATLKHIGNTFWHRWRDPQK